MYTLNLTSDDWRTIEFVGARYSWSWALITEFSGETGDIEIPEHQAWKLKELFEEDADGGHSLFPMLRDGDLMDKLIRFMDGIV